MQAAEGWALQGFLNFCSIAEHPDASKTWTLCIETTRLSAGGRDGRAWEMGFAGGEGRGVLFSWAFSISCSTFCCSIFVHQRNRC